jgi:trans-feruloyl-CoA hydratase/vanillin synthase
MALKAEYQTVKIEREDGITWVILNRPEKRNCMNPQMHFEMSEILRELETDAETQVMVLTGAGEAWCAGQDLKQFFRELDNDPVGRWRAGQATSEWRFDRLYLFPKPTIAMVNGYCFGGAFTQLFSCDFAIAAEDAIFGLSEVNWGIIPGGIVTKVVADALAYRDALYYIMTGDHFDGKQAASMRLVNYAVPRDRLREETVALCNKLKSKNPSAVRACKEAYKVIRTMDYTQAKYWLEAKASWLSSVDQEDGRNQGIRQFVDEKRYRPGLGAYIRDKD